MPKVFKYAIEPVVKMPAGATVLKCAYDTAAQKVCLWALVDEKAVLKKRYFATAKTGEALPEYIEDCAHVETIIVLQPTDGGVKSHVMHVFEVPEFLALKHKF